MPDSLPPETLAAWDRDHLWHPFTAQADWAAADPLIIDRAEGVYLFDIEGRRYLDGVGSLWCNVHGHRHPALDAALVEQLGKVAHSTLLGASHPTAIALARRLAEVTPEGLTRVFFSDDGATAVEVALKMAFQYWRQKPGRRAGPDAVRRAGGGVSRRHPRRRQPRRGRSLPSDVRPLAVRAPARPAPIATDARSAWVAPIAGPPASRNSAAFWRPTPGRSPRW